MMQSPVIPVAAAAVGVGGGGSVVAVVFMPILYTTALLRCGVYTSMLLI